VPRSAGKAQLFRVRSGSRAGVCTFLVNAATDAQRLSGAPLTTAIGQLVRFSTARLEGETIRLVERNLRVHPTAGPGESAINIALHWRSGPILRASPHRRGSIPVNRVQLACAQLGATFRVRRRLACLFKRRSTRRLGIDSGAPSATHHVSGNLMAISSYVAQSTAEVGRPISECTSSHLARPGSHLERSSPISNSWTKAKIVDP
jgi:hypothetical protein